MSDLRVVAISTEVAETVRKTMRAPRYGHPAHVETATSYGPCRHCLRYFEVGKEERVLFTYDSFQGVECLPLPGPVFIHKDACERYDEAAGYPSALTQHPVTVVAYGPKRTMLAEVRVAGAKGEATVRNLLESEDVEYVHVRDTKAGCYDFRVERSERAPEKCISC